MNVTNPENCYIGNLVASVNELICLTGLNVCVGVIWNARWTEFGDKIKEITIAAYHCADGIIMRL